MDGDRVLAQLGLSVYLMEHAWHGPASDRWYLQIGPFLQRAKRTTRNGQAQLSAIFPAEALALWSVLDVFYNGAMVRRVILPAGAHHGDEVGVVLTLQAELAAA